MKKKRRPRVTTRLEWAADDGPWVAEQRRRLAAGAIPGYPKGTKWATFCRLAVIRATIPDTQSMGGFVVPTPIAIQLSPAAIAELTTAGMTNTGNPQHVFPRPTKSA